MKKILKKYGEILKIFRKIEGRSYFIEFKEKVIKLQLITLIILGCFWKNHKRL